MSAMSARPFWTATAEAVLAETGSSSAGLGSEEAALRLRRVGPNEPAPPRRFEALREIAGFLLNPLVLILLAASAVSAVFGQAVSSAIIACMVLLSIVLNFTQTYQSHTAAQRLRDRVGRAARAAVEANYGWDRTLARLDEILEEAAGTCARPIGITSGGVTDGTPVSIGTSC